METEKLWNGEMEIGSEDKANRSDGEWIHYEIT